jgi:hypothetical protein
MSLPTRVNRARRLAARRGRRLRIMFADEARFGRMNRPRPCWAPPPVRPGVASQLIRKYIHLYGAVCSQDGACVYLIMPTSNTACFQSLLNVLSRRFARQHILVVLEDAPRPSPPRPRSSPRRPMRQRLHQLQSGTREINQIFPPHRQVILMWERYQEDGRPTPSPVRKGPHAR